jgi:hypothetical protein
LQCFDMESEKKQKQRKWMLDVPALVGFFGVHRSVATYCVAYVWIALDLFWGGWEGRRRRKAG